MIGRSHKRRPAKLVYLTAPKSLHQTDAYDAALRLLRSRYPDEVVVSARDAFRSRTEWLAVRRHLLSRVTRFYLIAPMSRRIGSGVAWEIAFFRELQAEMPIQAFKITEDGLLITGPEGNGYPVTGLSPDLSSCEWDTALSPARAIFEPPFLSIATSNAIFQREHFSTEDNGVFNYERRIL